MGVLETVQDEVPTAWCTNRVVASKKNVKIRFCSNMWPPSTAIRPPVTESLIVEDVKVKLSRAKVFSKLDMNEAYHHLAGWRIQTCNNILWHHKETQVQEIELHAISSKDIFDKAMDDTIHGLSNVLHIRDDFVVYGENTTEHDSCV